MELPWYTIILTLCSSCLSIGGAVVIFVTYALIPEIRNYTRRLLLYLTIADSFTAVGNFVASIRYIVIHHDDTTNSSLPCYPVDSNSSADGSDMINVLPAETFQALCEAQSFVTTVSNMSSYFWTFIIALHMCWSIVMRSSATQRKSLEVLYHCVSWILPVCIVSWVAADGYLGDDRCYGTGVWCGIRSDLDPVLIKRLMYVADVFWQLTCYILTCAMYVCLKLYLSKKHRRVALRVISPDLRDEDSNVLFMILIIYCLKLWGLLRFFITSYTDPRSLAHSKPLRTFLDVLLNLQSYGASGQAFWNCVLFCLLDRTVRQHVARAVCVRQLDEMKQLL